MDLKFLNEKMKDELDIKGSPEVKADDSIEDEEEVSSDPSSKSRVRIETESKIVGVIKNLTYDVKYKDLADKLTEEVTGLNVTRDKAKKIFKVIKDMMGF